MTTATPMRIKSYDKLLIGGVWTKPSSDAVIEVISPITGERIATVPEAREADVDAAVAAARKAFDEGPWPRMTPAERAEILVRVGDEVKQRIPEMAAAFTAELGAPAMISAAFHQNAVDMWDDAATFHERFEFEQERTWKGGHGSVVREPIGVVATIIPWNGPVATASLKISPGPGRGLHRRAQAGAGGPGLHDDARRGARRRRSAGGRDQRAAGRS